MPPPEGTVFSFKPVLQLQFELAWKMRIPEWDETPLVEERFQELAKLVYQHLGLEISSWDALVEQLHPLYGEGYTEQKRRDMAWRVAAAAPWLRNGYATKPVFAPFKEHWVPLIVEGCRYGRPGKRGEARIKVWLRIVGGLFSGLAFAQTWPHWYHIREVAKEIGFPLYQPVHYRELAGMWLGGLLCTEDPRYPTVLEIFGPSSAVTHNRALRKERAQECHRGFRWLCHECTIGLDGTGVQDGCRRATHLRTFSRGVCPRCKRKDAWFDPDSNNKWCLRCVANDAKARIRAGGK